MTARDRPALAALDAADPLARHREAFILPDGVIYLDGNSLGALPRATAGRVGHAIEQEWGRGLIRSWNTAGWMDFGVTPLYTRFVDVGDAVTALLEVLDSREWDRPEYHRRAAVT